MHENVKYNYFRFINPRAFICLLLNNNISDQYLHHRDLENTVKFYNTVKYSICFLQILHKPIVIICIAYNIMHIL